MQKSKIKNQNDSIRIKIEKDFINAYKGKDQSLETLRILKNAIKNSEIDKRDELTDQDILMTLQKQKKQREESIKEFKKGNRDDLAQKENNELKIILKYLPKSFSDEEIRMIIKKAISNTKAQSKSDFGKIMKKVMIEIKGRANGNNVSQITKEELEKLS